MKPSAQIRLSDHLSETRILTARSPVPLHKSVLRLAELMVRDGRIRNPLGFYHELVNPTPVWIASPAGDECRTSAFRVFQVCSSSVRRLTAALAVADQGARFAEGEAKIVALLASPAKSVSSCMALLNHTVRMLQNPTCRARLLSCSHPSEIAARIAEFDSPRTFRL